MADPYLTPADLRAARPSLAEFSDDDLAAAVAWFEPIAELARGVANVPREMSARRLVRRGQVELAHVEVTEAAITQAGRPVPFADLDSRRGRLHGVPTTGLVAVTYTHGYLELPALIRSATIEFVDRALTSIQSGVSRDVISQSFDGGFTRYSTPDWPAGRFTGFLQVDADLNATPDRRPRLL